MPLRDIEAEDFEKEIKTSDKPVIIEFWVRSCDHCRKFKPVYEQLAEKLEEKAVFLRINMLKSLENLRLSESMDVEQTPTTKVFCKGFETGSLVGYLPLDKVQELLEKILASKECISL